MLSKSIYKVFKSLGCLNLYLNLKPSFSFYFHTFPKCGIYICYTFFKEKLPNRSYMELITIE